MSLARRQFAQVLAAGAGWLSIAAVAAANPRPLVSAKRLSPGDTIALISPANATYER